MKNIIESQFTQADRTLINTIVADLESNVSGKTGVLSDEERKRYGSINEQNKLVVNKALEYRQNAPNLSSPGVDWAEFESDYQTRAFLENIINRLYAVIHDLESTKIMHDYDNFQDALKDYGYSQYQHGAGESGYSAKVEEFKQFFTKTPKSETPKDNETGKSGENQ